ncbi:MAG: hypothetical protein K2N22_04960 [Clostridia bacterium]|nr:hypothetical protein [Clostridia bacterium]
MKKIFKGLAITVAATAACAGIAVAATGCSAGKNGTYTGEYHYSSWGQYYGMVVEVKVENNIITGIKDITNTESAKANYQENNEWHVVSPGWADYYAGNYDASKPEQYPVAPVYDDYHALQNATEIEEVYHTWYKWENSDATNWTKHENWLLQQYVGWTVADVLNISVYHDNGEPYATANGYNAELLSSGLLITNATQGSGRLLLAVQDALGK